MKAQYTLEQALEIVEKKRITLMVASPDARYTAIKNDPEVIMEHGFGTDTEIDTAIRRWPPIIGLLDDAQQTEERVILALEKAFSGYEISKTIAGICHAAKTATVMAAITLAEYTVTAAIAAKELPDLQIQNWRKSAILAALKTGKLELSDIPYELRDERHCKAAIRQEAMQMKYVPEYQQTEELCLMAISEDPFALMGIHKCRRTTAMIKAAAIRHPTAAVLYATDTQLGELYLQL